MADVFVADQNATTEDDLILLRDLNVDEYHLGPLGQLPGIAYVISGVTTNTRRNKSYDNLVFDLRLLASLPYRLARSHTGSIHSESDSGRDTSWGDVSSAIA